MALKTVVESLDVIPEPLRGEYESRDGKFYLRLDGDPHGYVPAAKLAEFRENNIALAKERDSLKAIAEKYRDIDPDRAREALSRLQQLDEKKLLDAGNVDEIIAKRLKAEQAKWDDERTQLVKGVEKHGRENAHLREQLSALLIDEALVREAGDPKLGVDPAALHYLKTLARHGDHAGVHWKLGDDGQPVAVRANDQPAWSGSDPTKPLGLREWLEGVIKAFPRLAVQSTGGGAAGGAAGGGQTRENLAHLPPVERLKAARRLGVAQ